MRKLKQKCMMLIIFASFQSNAQDSRIQLFRSLEPINNVEIPQHVVSYYQVDVNFEDLRDFPQSLEILLPDSTTIVALTTVFYPRDGYTFEVYDEKPAPGPPVYITPGTTLEDMSYFWASTGSEYEVTLTVQGTIIHGSINGNGKKYVIESRSNQQINRIYEVDPEGLRPDGETDLRGESAYFQNLNKNKFDDSKITLGEIERHETNINGLSNTSRFPTENYLDTLVVFTNEARISEGGDPFDVNDDDDIQNLIANSIDNTNIALTNSEVDGRITAYYTTRLDGFVLTGGPNGYITDLQNFRTSATINSARSSVNADIVSGMVHGDVSQFAPCGVAHVQTQSSCGFPSNTPGCGVGTLFDPYAYNLVNNDCALASNVFPHEYGHLLGGNHSRSASASNGVLSDVINNGFPEAFGYNTPTLQRTVMTTENPDTRLLYFSNPNILLNGEALGDDNTEYNVNEFNSLIPDMVDFEDRPDLIFKNGFE